jgi:hypothetical protein
VVARGITKRPRFVNFRLEKFWQRKNPAGPNLNRNPDLNLGVPPMTIKSRIMIRTLPTTPTIFRIEKTFILNDGRLF